MLSQQFYNGNTTFQDVGRTAANEKDLDEAGGNGDGDHSVRRNAALECLRADG